MVCDDEWRTDKADEKTGGENMRLGQIEKVAHLPQKRFFGAGEVQIPTV